MRTSATSGRLFKLFILGTACLSQGMPLAFIQMGLPAILRGLNESLTTITLYSLLLLPWAGKFLYAPFLDHYYIKRIGKRRTWLMLSLLLSVATILFVAVYIPAESSPRLMITIFMLNLLLSINDTAVSAYSTDILTHKEMAWGSSVRLGGHYLGMIFGGGVILSIYSITGWENTFYLLGGLTLLMAVPAVLHKEIAPVHESTVNTKTERPSTLKFAKSPGIGWFILAEILFVSSIYSAFQTYPPFLIDLGFSHDKIGEILMYWAYPSAFATAVLSGWVMQKIPAKTLLPLCMITAAGIQLFAVHLAAVPNPAYYQALLLLAGEMSLGSIAGVVLYTMIMEVSVGSQAATNAGLLSSIANFTPVLSPPLLGIIGDTYGYQTMYGILAGSSILLALAVTFILNAKWGDYALAVNSSRPPVEATPPSPASQTIPDTGS
ncbi:MFS transporter [Marinifilum sp. JC120]|nr:MFS transporter [Marinifilum sp. JC120]